MAATYRAKVLPNRAQHAALLRVGCKLETRRALLPLDAFADECDASEMIVMRVRMRTP